jgi:hypothetical protein
MNLEGLETCFEFVLVLDCCGCCVSLVHLSTIVCCNKLMRENIDERRCAQRCTTLTAVSTTSVSPLKVDLGLMRHSVFVCKQIDLLNFNWLCNATCLLTFIEVFKISMQRAFGRFYKHLCVVWDSRGSWFLFTCIFTS